MLGTQLYWLALELQKFWFGDDSITLKVWDWYGLKWGPPPLKYLVSKSLTLGCLFTVFAMWKNLREPSCRPDKQLGVPAKQQGRVNASQLGEGGGRKPFWLVVIGREEKMLIWAKVQNWINQKYLHTAFHWNSNVSFAEAVQEAETKAFPALPLATERRRELSGGWWVYTWLKTLLTFPNNGAAISKNMFWN